MNGWRVVNVAAGCVAGGRASLLFFPALWAADKPWPLPLNEVHPARVVVAHDGNAVGALPTPPGDSALSR